MKERLEASKEVYDLITGNESFSRSGDEYGGKGGDYIKENDNKHIKGHIELVETMKNYRQIVSLVSKELV